MKPPIFLGQLLLRSMDRAVALYESMELWGFHGEVYYAEKEYNKLASWGYVIFWVSVFILMRTCSVTVLLGNDRTDAGRTGSERPDNFGTEQAAKRIADLEREIEQRKQSREYRSIADKIKANRGAIDQRDRQKVVSGVCHRCRFFRTVKQRNT